MKQPRLKLPLLKSRAGASAQSLDEFLTLARRNARSLHGGEMNRSNAGTGENFWQFKHYTQGDRPQDIDWRRSAKGAATDNDIFIRQKQKQDPQRITFWLAADTKMHFASRKDLLQKYEFGALLTMSLINALAAQEDNISYAGIGTRPARHAKHLDEIAATLYETKTSAPTLADLSPDMIAPQSALVLIGDFLEEPEAIKEKLQNLATKTGAPKNKIILIQIFDPAEIDFPFKGRTIFRVPGQDDKHDLTSAADIRDDYLTRLNAHRAAIENICHAHHFIYMNAHSDEDIVSVLRRFAEKSGAW